MAGSLSPRQRTLLGLAARGLTDEASAARMGVSTNTLRVHWRRASERLGTEGRTAAILEAIRRGEIRVPGVVAEGAARG